MSPSALTKAVFSASATICLVLALVGVAPSAALAQDPVRQPIDGPSGAVPPAEPGVGVEPRAATGGAPTLADIMARQRGETVSDGYRQDFGDDSDAAAGAIRAQLGTRGDASDADVFRQIRFGTGNIEVSTRKPVDRVMIQDGGMLWLEWRKGPVMRYGLWALAGTIVVLALFYLIRGRIRIEEGRSGVLIERFAWVERFGHWLTAGSFVLLALTGLFQLVGRFYIMPWLGKEPYAAMASPGKWIHDNVAWAFMLGLALIFVMWVWENFPRRADVVWLLKGGGMFTRHSNPPAWKFNAGQKILFWLVILMGASMSLSGLSLLFPFEIPMFAKTFAVLNDLAALVGVDGRLPTELQPHQEMQFAQIWHVIVGFAMMAMIIAHIYIGTVGMEGAFEAMGEGDVDLNWAREHHSLWAGKVEREGAEKHPDADPRPTPAE